MDVDFKLLLTLGGMLVSVVSAAVIVKTKLQAVIETLADVEQRLRRQDAALDRAQVQQEVMGQRVAVLSTMLAPEKMEARAREIASIIKDIEHIKRKVCT